MKQKLIKLTEKIFYRPAEPDTDRPVIAALSGERRTLLVDAGNSAAQAEDFLAALAGCGVPPPFLVVITHWHWDHIFGMSGMGLPVLVHRITAEKIREMLDWSWCDEALDKRVATGKEIAFCAEMIKREYPGPEREINLVMPDLVYEKRITADLGGLTCVVENVGGDHSADSSVIYAEEEKTLFLGDCLSPDLYSGKWKYRPNFLLRLAEKLEGYPAEIFLESHGSPKPREEFLQEVGELRIFARLMKEGFKSRSALVAALEEGLGRKLLRDDFETLGYFLNGREEGDHGGVG